MKVILGLLLITSALCTIKADANEQVLLPINNLFDAMREHNKDKLLSQFTHSALLQRVTKESKIKTSDINAFANSIGNSSSYLDEKLFDIEVNVSGNLASVWTPYYFYLDKKLHHCGVNSFQLIKIEKVWKIQYLIDNVYQGNCKDMITKS